MAGGGAGRLRDEERRPTLDQLSYAVCHGVLLVWASACNSNTLMERERERERERGRTTETESEWVSERVSEWVGD
jgi:hypothetical protein